MEPYVVVDIAIVEDIPSDPNGRYQWNVLRVSPELTAMYDNRITDRRSKSASWGRYRRFG